MLRRLLLLLLPALLAACAAADGPGRSPATVPGPVSDFLVIAHRGASGYLPEHSLEGVAMAHAMGVDYIEQDVVMTRDGRLVVLHDLTLDAVTDVAERFPNRHRKDGKYYALDFDLEEIRSLRLGERRRKDGGAEFPGRFPAGERLFRVPTFDEEIRLIVGLNHSTGRDVGLYVEPKSPGWHREQGRDLMAAVLGELARHGYAANGDRAYLQSFDDAELRRAREELGTRLKLVQLIGENAWQESATDFDRVRESPGLREVASFADGIGPWLPQVVDGSGLVGRAHEAGLSVHTYTLRTDRLPPGAGSVTAAVRLLLEADVDGVFTDQPDRVIEALRGAAVRP